MNTLYSAVTGPIRCSPIWLPISIVRRMGPKTLSTYNPNCLVKLPPYFLPIRRRRVNRPADRGSTVLWGPGLPIYHAIHFPWRLHMFRLQMNARVENGGEIYWQPAIWRERTCTQLIGDWWEEEKISGNEILQLVPLYICICIYSTSSYV